MDDSYAALYYQTIRDTGIDPVICGEILISGTGRAADGPKGGARPVQLAEKALAKASEGSGRAPRKRAAKKGTSAGGGSAGGGTVAGSNPNRVPLQTPSKIARGTAPVPRRRAT